MITIKDKISIHAAREGGDPLRQKLGFIHIISIHAAREGGDALKFAGSNSVFLFQSTPPVKAATSTPPKFAVTSSISIHAAREGGDTIHRHLRGV